jgi:hypothetical protein
MRATQSGKIDGAARAGEQTGRTAMGRRLVWLGLGLV